MKVDLSVDVPGVAPEAAHAWWSDFREGNTDHPFVPGERRRILEESPTRVVMEDETRWLGVRVFRERTTAEIAPGEVRIQGANGLAAFEGAYRFEAIPGGTRLRLVATVTLRRGLAWSDAWARPLVLAILRVDLRGHARDLEGEMARA